MKCFWFLLLVSGLWGTAGCEGPAARSDKSFDEIRELVTGKTAAEVAALLGEPDTRQPVLLGDERWIWWNYTFLGGQGYAPEVRDQVVHLEITFLRPDSPRGVTPAYSAWPIGGPLGVGYTLPSKPPLSPRSDWRKAP